MLARPRLRPTSMSKQSRLASLAILSARLRRAVVLPERNVTHPLDFGPVKTPSAQVLRRTFSHSCSV